MSRGKISVPVFARSVDDARIVAKLREQRSHVAKGHVVATVHDRGVSAPCHEPAVDPRSNGRRNGRPDDRDSFDLIDDAEVLSSIEKGAESALSAHPLR